MRVQSGRAKPTSQSTRKKPAKDGSKQVQRLKLPSYLAQAFRHIKPSWKHYLDFVELAAKEGDGKMERVMQAYYRLTARERLTVMPEQLCEYSGVQPNEVFGAVCAKLYAHGMLEANLITALAFPKVVERTAKTAATKAGVKDREMFHKSTGYLPTPAGPYIDNRKLVLPGVSAVPGEGTGAKQLTGPAPVQSLPTMEQEALQMEYATQILDAIPVDSVEEGS